MFVKYYPEALIAINSLCIFFFKATSIRSTKPVTATIRRMMDKMTNIKSEFRYPEYHKICLITNYYTK